MVIYASVAKSRADQDATNANLSYYFLFHILHCSSQVAAVFRDWDENPASSNKKRSLPAAENQMERDEFGEEVSEIFLSTILSGILVLGAVRLGGGCVWSQVPL